MAQETHALENSWIVGDMARHYTCNPASLEVLTHLGILATAHHLGCEDSREVLWIPKSIYDERGLNFSPEDIQLVSERLMRDITHEEKTGVYKNILI